MQDYKKLKVWEKAHLLTIKVYQETKKFPKEEMYGLISQIRRSVSSIPTNIAEGCGRKGNVEFARFLHIAFGSANEFEYQIFLANELKYLNKAKFDEFSTEIIEIKQMISSLLKKL